MLIYKDEFFKFYIEQEDNRGYSSLVINDAYNGFVFKHNFLLKFGKNPTQKVFRGKSGTYEYYKVTIKCDNIGKELVLIKISSNILRAIYLDDKYVDLSISRLRISTKKGGLNVRRVEKK